MINTRASPEVSCCSGITVSRNECRRFRPYVEKPITVSANQLDQTSFFGKIMVRTYNAINATTSSVGELFDLISKEGEFTKRGHQPAIRSSSVTGPIQQSRPISDISLGPPRTVVRPNSVPLHPRSSWSAERRQPIALPEEDAIFVEPVYGGNTRRQNQSYYDYDRQIREQDRQQRREYMQELQRQLEEQRERRLKTEIAFGGHEFEKELLMHQRQRGAAYSPSRNRVNGYGQNVPPANRGRAQNGIGFGYPSGNLSKSTAKPKHCDHTRIRTRAKTITRLSPIQTKFQTI